MTAARATLPDTGTLVHSVDGSSFGVEPNQEVGVKRLLLTAAIGGLCLAGPIAVSAGIPVDELYDAVEHGYADSDGVRIHYVTLGEGPLVLFIHGFPDQWYAWRYQMAALADDHQVVAISQRGYNRSDKPTGVEHYDIEHLTGDVAAVIRHLGGESAVILAMIGAVSCRGSLVSDTPR